MVRLLLGILDRANLRLGDNTSVNFENSLIFLTSNLGAREMMKELHPEFGFQAGVARVGSGGHVQQAARASRWARSARSSRRSSSTASTP